MAEHNYLGNMEGPCLYRFNCGHYCQEQINHRLGLMHELCLTLVSVELACGHIELIHCFQNELIWRCNICSTVQPIRRVIEDATAAANHHYQSFVVAQIGEVEQSIGVGAPTFSAAEQEVHGAAFGNDETMDTADGESYYQSSSSSGMLVQVGTAHSSEQPSTSQTQSGETQFKLGKRNFDETFPRSDDFDEVIYKRDETNQPPRKKL